MDVCDATASALGATLPRLHLQRTVRELLLNLLLQERQELALPTFPTARNPQKKTNGERKFQMFSG